MLRRVKDFFNTFLLLELFRGLGVTLSPPVSPQGHHAVSGRKDPA